MASSSSTSDSNTEKKLSSPITETPPLSTFIDMDFIDNSSSSVNSNPTTNGSQENIKLVSADPHNNELGLKPDTNNQMMQANQITQAPNTGTSLANTFLNLTYQAAIGFALFHYQTLSSSSSSSHIGPPSVPLHIVGIATVVGFSACFISILLHEPHPKAAAIFEKFGSASSALGFFVMMAVFLPSISQWISWLAGIGCFIAFVYSLLKMR